MGITHHSNYVRWMEEARIDFLESIGVGFDRGEAQGSKGKLTLFHKNDIIIIVSDNICVDSFKGLLDLFTCLRKHLFIGVEMLLPVDNFRTY